MDRFTEHTSCDASADVSVETPALESEQTSAYAVAANGEITDRRSLARKLRKQKRERISRDLFEEVALERSDVAFSELYDRLAPRIYAMLRHLMRSEEDALDLLQEVFILVWEKAPIYFHVTQEPTAWIIQLARNRAIDELRSRLRRGGNHFDSYDEIEDRPELVSLMSDFRTPESNLEQKQLRLEVLRAMQTLTPRERRLIDLIYFSGLEHREVAEIMQIPRGTVSFVVRQAVFKLRAVLNPRLGERDVMPVRRRKSAKTMAASPAPIEAPPVPVVEQTQLQPLRSSKYNDEWF